MKRLSNKAIAELFSKKAAGTINKVVKNICGDYLSYGLYRDVYALKADPDHYVVKIERDMAQGMFANATEWRNWINNKDWEWLAEYLCPCESINETGQVLIQRRAEIKPTIKAYQDACPKLPPMLTDRKIQNYGFFEGRVVCVDYSFMPIFISSRLEDKARPLRNANWWSLYSKSRSK